MGFNINNKRHWIVYLLIFAVLLIWILCQVRPRILSGEITNITKMSLYSKSIDINSFNSKDIVEVENASDINRIAEMINQTTQIKKVIHKNDEDSFVQNNPAGYIEILYKDGLIDKIYFTENKKAIYRFCKNRNRSECIYGNNDSLYHVVLEYVVGDCI